MKTPLKKVIETPTLVLSELLKTSPFNRLFSDEKYLKIQYRLRTKKQLNLEHPITYNEKLQWLKLYDRKNKYTIDVDKYLVRNEITNQIGEEYLVPIYGVYDKFEDIDFDSLPTQFVLKPNHTSGDVFICHDKNSINKKKLKKMCDKWLKKNYFHVYREWPYKEIQPKIICEKYLDSNVTDYKFLCFNGEPKFLQIMQNRFTKYYTIDFYDMNWNKTELKRKGKPNSDYLIEKPKNFEEMKRISQILSKDDIHVRVDLYEVDGKIFFGEKTYYPTSGFSLFGNEEQDQYLGSLIDLS